MFGKEIIDAIFSKDRHEKIFAYDRSKNGSIEIDVEKEFNKEQMIQSHMIMKDMIKHPEFKAILSKHLYTADYLE